MKFLRKDHGDNPIKDLEDLSFMTPILVYLYRLLMFSAYHPRVNLKTMKLYEVMAQKL